MTSSRLESPAVPEPDRASRPAREAGIDCLRAVAAVLVVGLHAGIPYLRERFPGLIWSVQADEPSLTANALCWWIDGFIMPLFFVMTGYFAAQLATRRGPGAFLRHRLARIGGPLLFACIVILPLDLYIWLLGWVHEDWIPFQKLRSLKIPSPYSESLWGVGHLWYLECVLLYCSLAAVVLFLKQRRGRRPTDGNGTVSPAAASAVSPVPSLLKLPARPNTDPAVLLSPTRAGLLLLAGISLCTLVLWKQPRIVIGFQVAWFPYLENTLFYAVPFSLGWQCQTQRLFQHLPRQVWGLLTLTAIILWGTLLPELTAHLRQETIPVQSVIVPALWSAHALTMAIGVFGLCACWQIRTLPAGIRTLSEASFWIYLFHHPVVGLMHVDLDSVPWSSDMKFLLSWAGATAVCLLTYQVFVRQTWIGRLLNGTRPAIAAPRSGDGAEIPATPRRTAA